MPMSTTMPFSRASVAVEYERASREFHALLSSSSRVDLKAPSLRTRWTNEELLFHMLFGYMILWTLLGLVRFVSRMPAPVGRGFARVLNAFTRPFDIVELLEISMGCETELNLDRGMPYPTRWDPFFTEFMSLGT
jgi:hypothetical protein